MGVLRTWAGGAGCGLRSLGWLLGLLVAVGPGRADEVVFRNGDRLTGRVTRLEGGRLTIEATVAGTVTCGWDQVAGLSVEAALPVHLTDGRVGSGPLTLGETGQVVLPDGEAVALTRIVALAPASRRPPAWRGELTAGLTAARGNADRDDLNLAANLQRRAGRDRWQLRGGYSYGRKRDTATNLSTTTDDDWLASVRYDNFFSDQFSTYLLGRIEGDKVADLDYRGILGGGLSYHLPERRGLTFSTAWGFSWFYERYLDGSGRRNDFSTDLTYKIEKQFLPRVRLFHDLALFPTVKDPSDLYLESSLGLRAYFTSTTFGQVRAVVNYDSTPAAGKEELDIKYIVGLGKSF